MGLLYMMAVPNFIAMSVRAKRAGVIHNMHTTQTAAELAGVDGGGTFPVGVDDQLKSYFPHGGNDGTTPAPEGSINPFTNIPEFPILGNISDVDAARNAAPADVLAEGAVEYSGIMDDPDSGVADQYAIRGAAAGGKIISNSSSTTLVLSCQ